MKNVSDKSRRETRNTHLGCSNFFFLENSAVYEIMWKNIVEPGRPQMTIRRMRIECWILKAINTYSGCLILIAFPLQQSTFSVPWQLRFRSVPTFTQMTSAVSGWNCVRFVESITVRLTAGRLIFVLF